MQRRDRKPYTQQAHTEGITSAHHANTHQQQRRKRPYHFWNKRERFPEIIRPTEQGSHQSNFTRQARAPHSAGGNAEDGGGAPKRNPKGAGVRGQGSPRQYHYVKS